jgi:hypothetical protein
MRVDGAHVRAADEIRRNREAAIRVGVRRRRVRLFAREDEIGLAEQPVGMLNTSGAGRSARLPSGAPDVAHFEIVSISASVRPRSSAKSPQASDGFHGGICRVIVMNG